MGSPSREPAPIVSGSPTPTITLLATIVVVVLA